MTGSTRASVVWFMRFMLAGGMLAGCGASSPSAPTAVAPTPVVTPTTALFTEIASGFSASDLRDVDDQIVQVNTAGELVWVADGTRLPGYRVEHHVIDGVSAYLIGGAVCPQGCALEVRFGTQGGERRAYPTADYGHDNPGTLVDVEVIGATLFVTRTGAFPPGTPTLSGIAFEATPTGRAPVGGVTVRVRVSFGWRSGVTDANGHYTIPGLFDVMSRLHASREGYETQEMGVAIVGDTELDIDLVRRCSGGLSSSAGEARVVRGRPADGRARAHVRCGKPGRGPPGADCNVLGVTPSNAPPETLRA